MNTKIPKQKRPISFWIGNLLILTSLLLIIALYLPLLTAFINPSYPQSSTELDKTGFTIRIPKIQAYATISENVDPWNEAEYQKYLQKGVAHAKGTAFPGEGRTIFLFAHSSDLPWRMTRYNTPFLRLGSLETGDKIEMHRNGKKYTYTITTTRTVRPSEIEYLKPQNTEELILQTCTPIGTSINRLLVFAKPEKT